MSLAEKVSSFPKNMPPLPNRKEKKIEQLPSLFESPQEAADEIRRQLLHIHHPTLNRLVVDAIICLQKDRSSEAQLVLQGIRDYWVEPFAMGGGINHEIALELSDILRDPDYARSIYRNFLLREEIGSESKMIRQEQLSLTDNIALPVTIEDVSGESPVIQTKAELVQDQDTGFLDSKSASGMRTRQDSRDSHVSLTKRSHSFNESFQGENRYVFDESSGLGSNNGFSETEPVEEIPDHMRSVWEAQAEDSMSYIRSLARLNRRPRLDENLLTHIIKAMEGGSRWEREVRTLMSRLAEKMTEEDRERLHYVLQDPVYAARLLSRLSERSLRTSSESLKSLEVASAAPQKPTNLLSRAVSSFASFFKKAA